MSSGLGMFRRHSWMNISAKLRNSTTPMIGWIQRVVCPPPNSPVRKYSDGSNSARPDSASAIRLNAVTQWFARVNPR